MRRAASRQAGPCSQANNVKRLKGEPSIYRLRVGDYRVLFSFDAGTITVLDIGPRGSIYD